MHIRFLSIFFFVSTFCSMSIGQESTTQSVEKFSNTTQSSDITIQMNQKFYELTRHAESFIIAAFSEMKTKTSDLTYGIDPFEFNSNRARYSFDFAIPFWNQELDSAWKNNVEISIRNCNGSALFSPVKVPFKTLPSAFQVLLLTERFNVQISACADNSNYEVRLVGGCAFNQMGECFEINPAFYYFRGELIIYVNLTHNALDGVYGAVYSDKASGYFPSYQVLENALSMPPKKIYAQNLDTIFCHVRFNLQARLIAWFEYEFKNQNFDRRSPVAIAAQTYADARRDLSRFFLEFSLARDHLSERDTTAEWDYYDELIRIHPVDTFIKSIVLDDDCSDNGILTTSTLPMEERILNQFTRSVQEIQTDALVIIED